MSVAASWGSRDSGDTEVRAEPEVRAGSVVPFGTGWSRTSADTVAPGIAMAASGAPASALGSGHCFSSTWGMSQEARKARKAIGTATRNTVWIDSA